ncbi:NEAT domain-containing protein [Lysinibacillus cavernae]|uniref:NEAT domain-containing protein n=1 Tax=Lysinibacillus cavernae TaxID=2666135 RepID=UPI001E4E777D|nr:NEAT domain-containing protein [Lysinibacillus cavernae]
MTLNRNNLCILAVSTIILFFFPHSIFLQAKAEESVIADGSYQVELSFSSIEGFEESLFKHVATLTVKNGQYQLTAVLEEPNLIKDIHIEQLGNELSFTLDRIENLVQFDVLALHQPIVIKGNIALETEEQYALFSQELTIETQTLSPNNPQGEEQVEEIVSEGITGQEWALDYVLLADGKQEPSIMNSYVNPVAKVIEKDGRYYVQMTILHSAWVTGLKVDYKGEQVEPKLLSLLDNVRMVEFEVEDLAQPLRMWVKIDISDIPYHHQYFVQLVFDQTQVAKVLNKPSKEPSSEVEVRDKGAEIVVKEQVQKQVQKPLVQTKIEKTTNAATSTVPTTQSKLVVPQEEKLAFDRTLDESVDKAVKDAPEENKKDETTTEKIVNQSTASQQIEPLNIVKIILLIVSCLGSGWLLVRRVKKAKQDRTEQK